MRSVGACFLVVVMVCVGIVGADSAEEILDATGVKGGLIVHLGCGDGKLTAALRANDRYLVHGLDADAENVEEARRHINSLGLYGPVSVDSIKGKRLPYADNLVNLLVVADAGGVAIAECLRAVAPGGVAYVKSGGKWHKTVKPRPDEIDEWTHHLHDAGGNAVASDLVVGPPQHLQWTAGPLWARSHGWTPSVSAMVSAGGRLFYICDETPAGADDTVPSEWFLVARDAFSGVLLWKRPISKWGSAQLSGTPDTGEGVTTGRFTMPPNAPKRLVAVGDTVYVTLGATAPVSALDAATGKTKRIYAETANADEIICIDGRLILAINPSGKGSGAAPAKYVCAVDAAGGDMLWKKGPFPGIRATRAQDPWGRLELAAGEGKVFILTTEAIRCLDIDSGRNIWRLERPRLPADAVRRVGFAGMYEYQLTVMVYHDGVVLLAQPEPNTHHTYHTMPGTLYAFAAKDGTQMWKHAYGGWGHCTPPDVFVVGDSVWTHVDADADFGSSWGGGFRAKDTSAVDYRIQALDLQNGKLQKEFATKDIFNVGHHHRCHRNKITERFLMSCRRGVEFVDLATGTNYQNHWVRSGCLVGYLPCNGLLYVTPHPCSCYITAKLNGFNALAPAGTSKSRKVEDIKDELRLEKGPAYGKVEDRKPRIKNANEGPTYRADSRRSGATESAVGADLEIAWQVDIGVAATSPVVAGGRVLVAGADAHTVWALDAANGAAVWKYTTGCRVDSPPTVYKGRAFFGSADGLVYCLRAADGAVVWRFNAAPHRRLVTAFGQLESPWPVPGSVLVHEDKCWFAAGRSSYLDGGIRLYALDSTTGKVLYRKTIYSPDPETHRMTPEPSGNTMAGVLNDIPVTDGANVFIRQMQVSGSDARSGQHLLTTGGFLDSSWFNRTSWQIGQAKTSGLMVLGADAAYGVELYSSRGANSLFTPGAGAYRLRCMPLKAAAKAAPNRRRNAPRTRWEQRIGIRAAAMVRAGNTIFVAGSPDVVDSGDPHGAWQGRKGGILAAYAAGDGHKLAEYKLPAPPVWDGMAAAGGRLYISTVDGRLLCMSNNK